MSKEPKCKDFIDGDCLPLGKRRLSLETCERYGYRVGTDKHGTTLQIANYYTNGVLVAQHTRSPDKDFRWIGDAKSVGLYGQHLFKSQGKRLVITEGEIDCLSISQIQGNKWPVVSVPNGAQSALKFVKKELEFIEGYEQIIFAFDMDEPGRAAAVECASVLSPGKAFIASYPDGYKDASDLLQAGKGDKLVRALWDAKEFRPDGIVRGEDIHERVMREPPRGLPVPYPLMQEKTYGIHKKTITLVTAGSGIGKSTWVHELANHLRRAHAQKLGIIALEESVERAAWRYMGMELDKPIHLTREGVTQADMERAYQNTVGNGGFVFYEHFGSTKLDTLMAKIKYMATGLGCDFIILDHISIVVSGLDELEDERKLIDQLMTKLRTLVEETGVGLIAVVHLKRKQHGSYNEGATVSLSDLRGSGALEQLSDTVIALERNQQGEDPNVSQLRILKNRPVGITGTADCFRYNPDTGRLLLDSGFANETTTTTEGEDF